MKNIIKNTMILTAITLVSGLLLGLVYEITKDPIAQAQEKAKQDAYRAVWDADSYTTLEIAEVDLEENGCTVDEVVEATTADGTTEAYVITTTSSEGYGGNIQITVGIETATGMVSGVQVLSISETAGLGMNAQKPEFNGQYVGKQVDQFVVTKTGASSDNEIDAISGATITSNAFTNAVNTALAYYNNAIGGSVNE